MSEADMHDEGPDFAAIIKEQMNRKKEERARYLAGASKSERIVYALEEINQSLKSIASSLATLEVKM